MATFKLLLHSANKRKNGSYPVSLRITKNMKHKYISLGLYCDITDTLNKCCRNLLSKIGLWSIFRQ